MRAMAAAGPLMLPAGAFVVFAVAFAVVRALDIGVILQTTGDKVRHSLIRIAVGLEDVADLQADLARGLAAL